MDTATSSLEEVVRNRLTLPGLREESLKIGPGGIQRGRYLLTFSRRALLPGPANRFAALADDLGVDATPLAPHLKSANAIHVGYEPGGVVKLYLEFPPPFAPEPDLAFLAVKAGGRVNRYIRQDGLTADDKKSLLHDVIPAGAIRDTATHCLAYGGPLLLVTEEGSTRRSLDIHLADADLTVGDLPGLSALLTDQSDNLEDIAEQGLGHFAAGLGRDGKPFATIYYGGRHDP